MKKQSIEQAYLLAREQYAQIGVNVDRAIAQLAKIPISLHCWQGDDVGGYEKVGAELSGGGIQATGNYPGKARTIDELRGDVEKSLSLIPGRHRLNLHACYLDNGGKYVDRNEMMPRHFRSWIDWAKANKLGMDFNPTYFSHPKAADGFTLSHPDKGIRNFWIEHGIACWNWGLVDGKSGTKWPWSSRNPPGAGDAAPTPTVKPNKTPKEPELWFHDILRMDGTAYQQKEVEFIKKLTQR